MKIPAIPKLSKCTWALIAAVLVILAAVPGLGVVRFTTSHPYFCLSCHKNQDPIDMWLLPGPSGIGGLRGLPYL
jgi:nitrate/TMAO reductase-like tetraheme cytochrome c subunit